MLSKKRKLCVQSMVMLFLSDLSSVGSIAKNLLMNVYDILHTYICMSMYSVHSGRA